MGAVAPKPPLAIPPHSKLRGFLTFSREVVFLLRIILTATPIRKCDEKFITPSSNRV